MKKKLILYFALLCFALPALGKADEPPALYAKTMCLPQLGRFYAHFYEFPMNSDLNPYAVDENKLFEEPGLIGLPYKKIMPSSIKCELPWKGFVSGKGDLEGVSIVELELFGNARQSNRGHKYSIAHNYWLKVDGKVIAEDIVDGSYLKKEDSSIYEIAVFVKGPDTSSYSYTSRNLSLCDYTASNSLRNCKEWDFRKMELPARLIKKDDPMESECIWRSQGCDVSKSAKVEKE